MKKPIGFVEQGEHYGYPPCCIAEFIEYVLNYDNAAVKNRGKRQLHGTGYVPCATCNKKTKKQLLFYIKRNRKEMLPFPQQSDE